MFVGLGFVNVGEVERNSGAQHGLSQRLLFGLVHSVEIDRHQQRADLVVRDVVMRYARDEEINLRSRELLAVALLPNDVLRSQMFSLIVYSPERLVINTAAWAVIANPWPTASSPSPVLALTLTQLSSTPSVEAMF